MEYLYLFVFCAFFSIQYIFKKNYERLSDGTVTAGLLCTVYSSAAMLLYLFPANGFRLLFSVSGVLYSFLYAGSNVIGSAMNLYTLRRGKLVVVTTYSLLGGFVLPFFWGVIVNGEKIGILKLLGMLLIVSGIVCPLLSEIYADKKRGGNGASLRFHLLCILQFTANGMVSVATSASQKASDALDGNAFLLLCLMDSMLLSILLLFVSGLVRQVRGEKNGIRNSFWEVAAKPPMNAKTYFLMILFCVFLSASNGIGNLFSLTCAKTMDASVQFPLSSAIMILMSAAIGAIFLHEKPDRNDVLRIIFSAVGMVCFLP